MHMYGKNLQFASDEWMLCCVVGGVVLLRSYVQLGGIGGMSVPVLTWVLYK